MFAYYYGYSHYIPIRELGMTFTFREARERLASALEHHSRFYPEDAALARINAAEQVRRWEAPDAIHIGAYAYWIGTTE